MKYIRLMLLAMLGLTFVLSTIISPIYAGDLALKIDTHNINTQSSWFQPCVIRKVVGRNYAWTVQGPVFFTKTSGKWPGWYDDSGALLWYMSAATCRSYKTPYIKGAKLGLLWAYIDPKVSGFKYLNEGINKSEIHTETYEFGNTSEN
jgi:hypothetical protein